MERNWYKTSKDWQIHCAYCNHEGNVASFVENGSKILSYYGFTSIKCPNCKKILIFDFEGKVATKIVEGRKPFPVMIGHGRVLDFIVILVGFFFILFGLPIWFPVLYLGLTVSVILWELILKKQNPDWYWEDTAFQWLTDRIAYLGLPISIIKIIMIVFMLFQLLT